jgi:hypothetical protein
LNGIGGSNHSFLRKFATLLSDSVISERSENPSFSEAELASDRTMAALDVKLSACGMGNIPGSKIENDFRFIVGESCYPCPWFVADFIAPKVGRLHCFDPSAREFCIETDDPTNLFPAFLSLGLGQSVRIDEENRSFFLAVACELGNSELYFSIVNYFEGDLSVSNIYERFGRAEFFDFFSDKTIEFIAFHFWELDSSFVKDFPISTLSRVFAHRSLRIESEDSLYDLISSHFNSDSNYFHLLEFVRFEFLSVDRIAHFLSWTNDHFDQINLSLWRVVTSRLALEVLPDSVNTRVVHPRFVPATKSALDGIIAHLSRQCGGNVHEKGVVLISGTSASDHPSYAAKNAADLLSPNYFYSRNDPDQWISYDFNNRRIRVTHYSFQAYSTSHLRSWVLEGSRDGSDWIELDHREGNSDTDFQHPIGTFSVARSEESRCIRLKQIGKNQNGNDILYLHAFEVFGAISE